MTSPRVAILTTSHDQHAQLLHQIGGIALGTLIPDLHVVVAMADKTLATGKVPLRSDRWETIIRTARTDARGPLPVAAARNLAAHAAIEAGSEVLIFLDAHLIPGPRLLEAAVDRATSDRHQPPVLWCGELRRLPRPKGPGQPVHALEDIASAAPNPPLLPPDHETVVAGPESVAGGTLVITAQGYRGTDGFPVGVAGAESVDVAYARTIQATGGTIVRFGGGPAYQQSPTADEMQPPA